MAAQAEPAAAHLQTAGPVLNHAGASPNQRNLPATSIVLQGLAALIELLSAPNPVQRRWLAR